MNKIKYPIIKPYVPANSHKRIKEVIKSGWLTQGKYVTRCEEAIKKYTGSKYAFMLNSATSGLIAGVKAFCFDKKDEIICPSFTFPATANAIILNGAKPVFCDIELSTFNISPDNVKKLLTKRTKAIMVVSEFGMPADMKEIAGIAKRHKLRIIEDSACAMGSMIKDKKIGTFGDIGVFSFHPRKIITSGEGGCVITDDNSLAAEVESLRNHGISKSKFLRCGYNFRMSDVQAALVYDQIVNFDKIISRRVKLAGNYDYLLEGLEKKGVLRRPRSLKGYRHTYQSYVILLDKSIDRDKLKRKLSDKGVESQFGTYCVPIIDFYRKNFVTPQNRFRNAKIAYRSSLALPLYHGLKERDLKSIVNSLSKIIKNACHCEK